MYIDSNLHEKVGMKIKKIRKVFKLHGFLKVY
jgi:hypothetical protein